MSTSRTKQVRAGAGKSDWVINDSIVQSVRLIQPYQWYKRFDSLPFMLAYAICLPLSQLEGTEFVGLVLTPCVLAAHMGLFLLAQISPSIRCSLGNRIITNISDATSVLVHAQANAGKDRVCELVHELEPESEDFAVAGVTFRPVTTHFVFQNVKYEFDEEKNTFAQVVYPTSSTLGSYCSHTGHESKESVLTAFNKWGRNEFEIPMPEFVDLYMENLVAPFFIFQILCLLLWSLDDYWYYSLFTMIMLFFFEALMANQRLAGLQTLRTMRRPPIHVYCFRGNQWQLHLSDQLMPGDIISITSNSVSVATTSPNEGATSEEAPVPCDLLLVRGSCVANEAMLTGESVPQVKESLRSLFEDADGGDAEVKDAHHSLLQRVVDLGDGAHSNPAWSRHVLFSGTTISQHTETLVEEEQMASKGGKGSPLSFNVPRAPDKGCQAIVLRTSFGTCQGGLMRTILYSSERVTTSSSSFETFLFIGMLLIFALVASGVVLHGGLYDENRNKFKLVLHCIMIITSVVPPELPMELSLAVTTSLAALVKNHIYCTEAYRINFAGKVNILCFDKTGTLTQDKMVLRGMVDPQDLKFDGSLNSTFTSDKKLTSENSDSSKTIELELDEVSSPVKLLLEPDECADLVLTAMAACQALITSKTGSILGDPLEVETFQQSEFNLVSGAVPGLVTSARHTERGLQLNIMKRYPFSSVLKRMSVIASVTSTKSPQTKFNIVCCKGAPEVVMKFLSHVPANYVATYQLHMALGRRVIALAYKPLDVSQEGVAGNSKSRGAVESELTFLSFIVFDSSLKSDTKSVMKDLRNTSIPMMMITGDSPFTAADIGQKLYITKKDKPSMILDVVSEGDGIDSEVVWRRALSASEQLEGKTLSESDITDDVIPLDVAALSKMKKKYNLIVTGAALNLLQKNDRKADTNSSSSQALTQESVSQTLQALSANVQIFARTSPQQKEQVLWALNKSGFTTLMCGDGTNDVGALKAAHVGISVINNAELEGKLDKIHARMKKEEKKRSAAAASGSKSKDRMMRAMLEQQTMDPTVVKFGDASIASPFTARRTSVDSVLTVLRQGRCTLVTTIQVYKILALNCLVSAYLMSSLYLMGLKQGDTQMTALGLVTACMFFCISQAKPLAKLSDFAPACSVFQGSVLGSILGQFVIHFSCLFAVLRLCQSEYALPTDAIVGSAELTELGTTWTQVAKPIADSRFTPDIINTAMFLLSGTISMNNFLVNYRGHPFSQNIRENKLLFRVSCAVYCVIVILVLELFEPFSDLLQLVAMPSQEFQYMLGGLLILDLVACWGVEKFCQIFERRG